MAYNGYNGYGEDMDGVETSGPKVTVREVSHHSFRRRFAPI
jgi:hypothetical protein